FCRPSALPPLPYTTLFRSCRDLACVLGGPNPALPATVAYSEAHYNEVMKNSEFASLASYQILLVDSLTAASRLSFTCAEQQPERSEEHTSDLQSLTNLLYP